MKWIFFVKTHPDMPMDIVHNGFITVIFLHTSFKKNINIIWVINCKTMDTKHLPPTVYILLQTLAVTGLKTAN